MPTLWRYLLTQYLRVLALAVVTFILVLFVSRAKAIAEFAAMGAGVSSIGLFALYLVPYVLPYAIPVAGLLASILLFQRLSSSHELTAMRACGLGLRQITGPILLAGAAMGLLNFYVSSELATHSHMLGRRMEAHFSSVNPLHLLQNTRLLRMGDLFVDMRTLKTGEEAEKITLAIYNNNARRLNLATADRLSVHGDVLHADKVSIVTSLDPTREGFDHLIVENQDEMWMSTSSLVQLIRRVGIHVKHSHLKLRFLLVRIGEERALLHQLVSENHSPGRAAELRLSISKGWSEIARRLSLGLAAFTFTLMGCAFGIHISRRNTRRGLVIALALSAFYIASFSVANGLGRHALLSCSLTFLPHLIIIPICILMLKRVTRGAAA